MANPHSSDVVFDFDGVLADSAPLIVEVLGRAIASETGTSIEASVLRSAVGPPFRDAVRHLLADAGHDVVPEVVDAVLIRFRDEYWKRAPYETAPFAGIEEAVMKVAGSARVTICSSKPYPLVAAILASWSSEFTFADLEAPPPDHVEAKSEGLLRLMTRNAMRPMTTLMVGDTVFDIRAAQAVGARCVGVGWGVGAPESLRAEGAHAVALTPPDLPAAVTEMLR